MGELGWGCWVFANSGKKKRKTHYIFAPGDPQSSLEGEDNWGGGEGTLKPLQTHPRLFFRLHILRIAADMKNFIPL